MISSSVRRLIVTKHMVYERDNDAVFKRDTFFSDEPVCVGTLNETVKIAIAVVLDDPCYIGALREVMHLNNVVRGPSLETRKAQK